MNERNRDLLEQIMLLHGLLARQLHQGHRDHGPMGMPYTGQGRVLKLLKLKPEMMQRELAELLGVRPQSLGELLGKLEKNGYVTRTLSQTDKRAVVVRLTQKGLSATQEEIGTGEDVFACLSGEEQETLSGYLERVIASLEERSAPGERRGRREFPGRMRGDPGCPYRR